MADIKANVVEYVIPPFGICLGAYWVSLLMKVQQQNGQSDPEEGRHGGMALFWGCKAAAVVTSLHHCYHCRSHGSKKYISNFYL